MSAFAAFSLIFVAGFFPALIWLWLVLTEDRVHPEPRKRLVISFLVGMLCVLLVLPFQHLAYISILIPPLVLLVWAFLEELLKFASSYIFALRTRDVDEPLDEIIYLAAVALGFAAAENILFIAEPILTGNISEGLLIAHARFLGSTLIHLLCAVIIGIFLAETFFEKRLWIRILSGCVGVGVATIFHSLYNLFVLSSGAEYLVLSFLGLWLTAGIIMFYTHHSKVKYVINHTS